ncbi:MAG: hypothetical protein ABI665_03765 [Vicinamibacterales bacterium]
MKKSMRLVAGVLCLLAWTAIVGRVASEPDGLVWRNLSPTIWLFQGIPVEATYLPTPFKTIQALSITISSGALTGTGTLSPAVVLANTVVASAGQTSDSSSGFHNGGGWAYCLPTATTTVTCTRGVIGYTVVANVTVVEFAAGLMRSVQCNTVSLSGLTGSIGLSPAVTASKAALFYTGITDSYSTGSSTSDGDAMVRLSFNSGIVTATKAYGGAYNNTVGFCVAEGR